MAATGGLMRQGGSGEVAVGQHMQCRRCGLVVWHLLGQLSVRCPHKSAALLVTGGSEKRGAHWKCVSTTAGGLVKGVSGEDTNQRSSGSSRWSGSCGAIADSSRWWRLF
jgi:hypothetical protein